MEKIQIKTQTFVQKLQMEKTQKTLQKMQKIKKKNQKIKKKNQKS